MKNQSTKYSMNMKSKRTEKKAAYSQSGKRASSRSKSERFETSRRRRIDTKSELDALFEKKRVHRSTTKKRIESPRKKTLGNRTENVIRHGRIKDRKPKPSPAPPRVRGDVVFRTMVYLFVGALFYFVFNSGWLNTSKIEVEGNSRLRWNDVIQLAGLEDAKRMWAFAVPRDEISTTLAKNPMIEYAEVSMRGPNRLKIFIRERKAAGALEVNGSHLMFDGSGELIEILSPREPVYRQIVAGMPPCILKLHGKRIYEIDDVWDYVSLDIDEKIQGNTLTVVENQFEKLLILISMMEKHEFPVEPESRIIRMDEHGKFSLYYGDYPEIRLGRFDYPEEQFRRVKAVLNAMVTPDLSGVVKPVEYLYVDLSTLEFPFFKVKEKYFNQAEKTLLANKASAQEAADSVPINQTAVKTETTADDNSDSSYNLGIFFPIDKAAKQ